MENEKINDQQPQPTNKDKAFNLAFDGPKKDYSALDRKINAKGNYLLYKNNPTMRSYGKEGFKDFTYDNENDPLESMYKKGSRYEGFAQKNGEIVAPVSDKLHDRYQNGLYGSRKENREKELEAALELAGLGMKFPQNDDEEPHLATSDLEAGQWYE